MFLIKHFIGMKSLKGESLVTMAYEIKSQRTMNELQELGYYTHQTQDRHDNIYIKIISLLSYLCNISFSESNLQQLCQLAIYKVLRYFNAHFIKYGYSTHLIVVQSKLVTLQ